MIYKRLKDGSHKLNITGPELADIVDFVTKIPDDPSRIGVKLFHLLRFQDVYREYKRSRDAQLCFEKVYKHTDDGVFQLTFTDSEYLTIGSLILSLGDDADAIGQKLFDALGFQEAYRAFINSPEGPGILLRTSPEEGHA
jgi:hypothetical protein